MQHAFHVLLDLSSSKRPFILLPAGLCHIKRDLLPLLLLLLRDDTCVELVSCQPGRNPPSSEQGEHVQRRESSVQTSSAAALSQPARCRAFCRISSPSTWLPLGRTRPAREHPTLAETGMLPVAAL